MPSRRFSKDCDRRYGEEEDYSIGSTTPMKHTVKFPNGNIIFAMKVGTSRSPHLDKEK